MSGGQSSTPFEGRSSPQRYGFGASSSTNIQGNHSGNIDSNNTTNSGNTTIHNYYNQAPMNPPKDYTEILQCLYTSQYENHRKRIRQPVEGTCTWVTAHPKYKDWLENKASGLLWLSAEPGYGKSVIASFLVKHLETQTDATICYFFFKDDSDEQKSAAFALCAILHQLFTQRNSLCRHAEQAFKAKGKKFTKDVDKLWSILVKAVAEAGCGSVICVIDGLDECEEVTLAPLLRHLSSFSEGQNCDIRLKLLVTSRLDQKIERGLSHATTIRLEGEDEINSVTSDVTRVIDEGIEDLEEYWGRPGGLRYLRDLLKSSADRTFIWVELVLDILKDSEEDSEEEFTNIVSTAPRDLAELYTKILDKNRYPSKARQILNIIVAAVRPLTLREMNVAFKMSRDRKTNQDLYHLPPGFAKMLKYWCGRFIRIIGSEIYLVHQTAREFLIESSLPGQGNWQYTLSLKDSNFVMADICISYLGHEEFDDDLLAINADGTINGSAVDDYLQKYPFLDYAAGHWADHFRDCEGEQMELFESTRLVCRAGSNRFRTWLQVYWHSSAGGYLYPQDWTHLMIASWLGQKAVVERLLEAGGDINARSEKYGPILNIAAIQKDCDMTEMLLDKNAKAYINEREYNIRQTKRSDLERDASMSMADRLKAKAERLALSSRRNLERAAGLDEPVMFSAGGSAGTGAMMAMMERSVERARAIMEAGADASRRIAALKLEAAAAAAAPRREDALEARAVEFLKHFCIQDQLDRET